MSMTFAVSDFVFKQSTASAFKALEFLRKTARNGKKDVLVDLVDLIKKTYPCITKKSYTDNDDNFEWIWADGPLEENIVGLVWTFSLVSDGFGEPLAYIINEANKVGCTVFSYDFDKVWWAEDYQ